MYFLSPTYLMYMIPAFILMAITSWYVKSAYNKWSRVAAGSRFNGYEATRRLIASSGLHGVKIQGTPGEMTDHYDPRDKTVYLSNGVANSASVAALAIAAHELGHAQQDAEEYFPLKFRAVLVPLVNIGSNLGWILIMIGLLLQMTQLAWVGILVFSGGALFALVTLPVEFDASARARRMLAESGIIQTDAEMRGVSNVLNAAALTYVAGLVTAVLQLLYYVSLVSGRSRD
ncbi:MAG: zinc metallopeptidase [Anaerolineales bacterium]|jgi:Zn-dependent membrane protease YugP|uniref:zinc metallopeptidase n=1 Tax=Candidatus Villigracilis vicinus TaxID=3140679 RepID=UPI0031351B64|nr:zinc metallopeptidase [Anaerolineales bacterium]MBK9779598.1 zinc metallopeptidase [Anaerolineales bacterium]